MKNKITSLVLIFGYLTCLPSYGQSDRTKNEPSRLLQNFENITRIGSEIYYEQRLYRNPFIGIIQLKQAINDTTATDFIPLFQGIPIGKYKLDHQVSYTRVSALQRRTVLKMDRFPLHLQRYKLDIFLQPYFAAVFGNFNRPVESNTSLGLQTQLFIVPGLSLSTGVLFPIVNQMDGRPKRIRPAPTFLNHFYTDGAHFISTSAGFFNNDQYGLNIQYRKADLAKPFSFGLEAGLTGFYYYPRGGIYYETPNQLLLLIDGAYRFKKADFTVKVSAGQFLWADKGARLDLIRQFTNVELGFYASKTQNGSTLGFNFAIAIPPGKIAQGKNVRIRTTDEFRWEYTYTRGYKIGERYRVGYQLDQRLRQYHADYFDRQWQLIRK